MIGQIIEQNTGQIVDSKRVARAVALVPAYNEEDIIERTIRSLMNQTYPFEYVLVIANNCTDETIPIVQSLQREYGYNKLCLLVMDKNPDVKAGALNYGLRFVDSAIEFVFSMDGDTIVEPHLLEEALKKMQREQYTAIVTSAYRTMPIEEIASRPTAWQRFLWRLQNIEFSLANAWRIENYKSARVAPGVASLYRHKALEEVIAKSGNAWALGHLVEDYVLTLDVKDLGWDVKSYHDMVSWSDVPLDLGTLWKQRTRWYSGTIDVIRERRLKRHSRYELFTVNLLMLTLLGRVLLVGTYGTLVALGVHVVWLTPFAGIILMAIFEQYSRLRKYGDQLDWIQRLMTLTLVANELYAVWREVAYAYALFQSFFRPNRAW
jgi:cellulose synthase/poly-beta-1,6-N-acetylglucosamine synthase-like glycosyltransferase